MIDFPNAKINIGLNITEKRLDGFHNIETVFFPIKLNDVLEINKSDRGCVFNNTGLTIDNSSVESNLCYKAYLLLKNDFNLPDINIHLHKIIPFGAGLGGGSSDASFTLKMLNSIFNLNLTKQKLVCYAQQLGSDCAIFIENKPAFAEQRGDILTFIDVDLSDKYLVLIHPGIHINTGLAYSKITPRKTENCLLDLIKEPIDTWKTKIFNDFEDVVFSEYPEIKQIKEKLYDLGAVYSAMSGSGSSVYGIFNSIVEIKSYFENYFVWEESL
ncbi:MAG: 4-(cytidine 5'-diphospho)-2-C-methyl-D-erythritol kinase [Bacteroidales bacterium]|nr:4-(cytidine 5'-diphospho)-2-C-methyl-D-erythritol kinase [Bacteroidales bacterium]